MSSTDRSRTSPATPGSQTAHVVRADDTMVLIAKRIAAAACLLGLAACRGTGDDTAQSGPSAPSAPPAAESSRPAQSPAEAALQAIKERYADIANRRQSFRRVERDLSDFSTEGGMLSAFLEGGRLRLIEATLYGETEQSRREFYYDDAGRPFFVLETESRYERPFGPVARTREYRYYFHEGRLLRLVNGERNVSVDDAEYAPRAKMVVQLSEELRKAARRP